MIIVTGGAGFIGSNLVAGLQAKTNHRIVVCDQLGSDHKWKNLAKRQLYDIVPPDQLFSFLDHNAAQVQVVYHMGAISSTVERDVDLIIKHNIRFSLDLLRWCAGHRVRFIYASSAATYGDAGAHGFKDIFSSEALANLRPLNPYGWSKHQFDQVLAQMQESNNPDTALPAQCVGLKFFNVYGPNEYHKGAQASVIAPFTQQIQKTGEVNLFRSEHSDYEDGGQMRDFVSVKDCEDLMLWLYDHPEVSGLFNVGTGQARRFDDLAKAIFSSLGKTAKIKFIEMPENLKTQYQYYTQADISNLRKAGYDRPFTSLEDGVQDYVQNYLIQPDPYR